MSLSTTQTNPKALLLLLAGNILSHTGSGITTLSIPWFMIRQSGGEITLGYTTIGVSLLMTVILPYIGLLVDRFSRKGVLVAVQLIGLLVTFWFAVLEWKSKDPASLTLIVLFALGSMLHGAHAPAMLAFVQERFSENDYRKINGLMEVQGQMAMMTSGGLGGMLLDQTNLSWILCLDALTYLIGAGLFMLLPYTKSKQAHTLERLPNFWQEMKEGFHYAWRHKRLSLFWIATLISSMSTQVINYLVPIHISKTLHANATIFGVFEMTWAAGAILAGITLPVLIYKLRPFSTTVVAFIGFTLGMASLSFIDQVMFFGLVALIMGWSNAGVRISRNTMMMDLIANHMMGRLSNVFLACGVAIKVALMSFFTHTVTLTGTHLAFGILTCFLLLTFFGILACPKRSRDTTLQMTQF